MSPLADPDSRWHGVLVVRKVQIFRQGHSREINSMTGTFVGSVIEHLIAVFQILCFGDLDDLHICPVEPLKLIVESYFRFLCNSFSAPGKFCWICHCNSQVCAGIWKWEQSFNFKLKRFTDFALGSMSIAIFRRLEPKRLTSYHVAATRRFPSSEEWIKMLGWKFADESGQPPAVIVRGGDIPQPQSLCPLNRAVVLNWAHIPHVHSPFQV